MSVSSQTKSKISENSTDSLDSENLFQEVSPEEQERYWERMRLLAIQGLPNVPLVAANDLIDHWVNNDGAMLFVEPEPIREEEREQSVSASESGESESEESEIQSITQEFRLDNVVGIRRLGRQIELNIEWEARAGEPQPLTWIASTEMTDPTQWPVDFPNLLVGIITNDQSHT